jgi:hypothetical protein
VASKTRSAGNSWGTESAQLTAQCPNNLRLRIPFRLRAPNRCTGPEETRGAIQRTKFNVRIQARKWSGR